MLILALFAFISGLATIVSPCVLPVLPLVLSTTTGGGRWRPIGIVLGFAASFVAATLALVALFQALGLPQDLLRLIAVTALGLFGLSMLIPSWGRILERRTRLLKRTGRTGRPGNGFGSGLLLGSSLGLVWSPCVGPIMASVIALAITSGLSGAGIAIALAYAFGAGVPMLLIAYGARRIASGAKGLRLRSQGIRRAFGGLTVLMSLLLLLGLQSRVQNFLPVDPSTALTGYERSDTVQKEIAGLQQSETNKSAMPPIAAAVAPAATRTQAPAAPAAPTTALQKPVLSASPTVPPLPMFKFPEPFISLPDKGPAPELTGLQGWINSPPLTIHGLAGKVVIVDFWTFECYNCANTLPYVKALYDKYHSQGLEILGIHTPEFAFERVPGNVAAATKDQNINWPVGLDPDYKTWNAYNNMYWPAFYFIDAKGHVRYQHFGEGNYDYNEKVVQQLLYESRGFQ